MWVETKAEAVLEICKYHAENVPLTSELIKSCAHVLKRDAVPPMSLAQGLEAVARAFGYASWNAAKALLPAEHDNDAALSTYVHKGSWPMHICPPRDMHEHVQNISQALQTRRRAPHLRSITILFSGEPVPTDLPIGNRVYRVGVSEGEHFKVVNAVQEARRLRRYEVDEWIIYQSFRHAPHLIVVPDARRLSKAGWKMLAEAAVTGHQVLGGHVGTPHPAGFVRLGKHGTTQIYGPLH